MNWKKFKEIMEYQGIKDNTEISYIDTDMYAPQAIIYSDGSGAHIE